MGMKTAISIPDEVFEEAERLAKRMRTSRSKLYSRALAEFIARHQPDEITARVNEAMSEIGVETDEFAHAAAREVFKRVEW